MAISKVKERRLELGLRQLDVAIRSGLSIVWVHFLETGYKGVSLSAKRKIAKALNSTVAELFPKEEGQEDGKKMAECQ